MEKFEFSKKTKEHAKEIGEKLDFNPFLVSTLEKGNLDLVENMISTRQKFLEKEMSPEQIVKFLSSEYPEAPKILLRYAKAYVEYGKLAEECGAEFADWQSRTAGEQASLTADTKAKEK